MSVVGRHEVGRVWRAALYTRALLDPPLVSFHFCIVWSLRGLIYVIAGIILFFHVLVSVFKHLVLKMLRMSTMENLLS